MVSLKNEQKYMLLSPKISRLNIELSRNIVRKHIFPRRFMWHDKIFCVSKLISLSLAIQFGDWNFFVINISHMYMTQMNIANLFLWFLF